MRTTTTAAAAGNRIDKARRQRLVVFAFAAAVLLAAMSDELRADHDPDANGALSFDLVAIIVVVGIVGAFVFLGLPRWLGNRARPASAVLAVLLTPILWWTGAPLVAAAAPLTQRRQTEARWPTVLAWIAVAAVVVIHVATIAAALT